jgi:hypothetical protein
MQEKILKENKQKVYKLEEENYHSIIHHKKNSNKLNHNFHMVNH